MSCNFRARAFSLFIMLRAFVVCKCSYAVCCHHLFLDQELISYRYSSCWSDPLEPDPKAWLRCFQSDQDEIWQECSYIKYASVDGVGFWI